VTKQLMCTVKSTKMCPKKHYLPASWGRSASEYSHVKRLPYIMLFFSRRITLWPSH